MSDGFAFESSNEGKQSFGGNDVNLHDDAISDDVEAITENYKKGQSDGGYQSVIDQVNEEQRAHASNPEMLKRILKQASQDLESKGYIRSMEIVGADKDSLLLYNTDSGRTEKMDSMGHKTGEIAGRYDITHEPQPAAPLTGLVEHNANSEVAPQPSRYKPDRRDGPTLAVSPVLAGAVEEPKTSDTSTPLLKADTPVLDDSGSKKTPLTGQVETGETITIPPVDNTYVYQQSTQLEGTNDWRQLPRTRDGAIDLNAASSEWNGDFISGAQHQVRHEGNQTRTIDTQFRAPAGVPDGLLLKGTIEDLDHPGGRIPYTGQLITQGGQRYFQGKTMSPHAGGSWVLTPVKIPMNPEYRTERSGSNPDVWTYGDYDRGRGRRKF